jgi:cytochrome c oxidase subunit 2
MASRTPLRASICLAAALCRGAQAGYAINLAPPATPIAEQIYDLHTLVLWICAAIFFAVFIPMFWSILRHRRSRGHPPARFSGSTRLEIAWTVVPVLILIGMAWPAARTVVAMKDTSRPDLTIQVTGHQWKWEYAYLGEGVRFFSSLATPHEQIYDGSPKGADYLLEVDRPLVVPVGRKVRLVLTSADVIHAWWVPEFGVKQDAIPGFVRDSWFEVRRPGTYRGQCAELCGVGHGYMPVVVEALPPERFAAWLAGEKARLAAASQAAAQEQSLAELVRRGEQVYKTHCAACHGAQGNGVTGAFPPLDGSPIVRRSKQDHLRRVFEGKPGTAMAAFGKQLDDLDIAAVVSYERNSWSNRAGDVVQPAEVAALRR